MVYTKKPPHFIASAHSLHAQLQEESLAQPTMLLAFCAEGFALYSANYNLLWMFCQIVRPNKTLIGHGQ